MSKTVWAIIPARSGSKGFKDKNIQSLNGIPLLAHTINFAKKTMIFDKILLSTDSKKYSKIGQDYGAWVPFLRSDFAARDDSMEEDIHLDLETQLTERNIQKPDIIVWLRPTFIFRSVKDLKYGLQLLSSDVDSVRFVTKSDSRIYYIKNNFLKSFSHLPNKSMIRRQELTQSFHVYHTDIYWYENIHMGKKFLGDRIVPYEINPICQYDIDSKKDFEITEMLLNLKHPSFSDYINI